MFSAHDSQKPVSWLDYSAIGLSGLCILHCLVTTLLIGLLASSQAFQLWTHVGVHIGLLALAAPLALWSLGRSYVTHRSLWPLLLAIIGLKLMALALFLRLYNPFEEQLTIVGVSLLAAGHIVNLKLHRHLHLVK